MESTVAKTEGKAFADINLKDIVALQEKLENATQREKQAIICSKKMQKIIEAEIGVLVPRYFDYVINRPYKKYVRVIKLPSLELKSSSEE